VLWDEVGEGGRRLDLKDALLISQVLGYALSKWLSVKFVSSRDSKLLLKRATF